MRFLNADEIPRRTRFISKAKTGLNVKETLGFIRRPNWQWNADTAGPAR